MADRTMKQGDTDPPLPIQPRQQNGAPVDLTDIDEIRVWIKSPEHSIVCDPQNVTVDGDATEGNAFYNWQAGDTDNVGVYDVEFQIVWLDGRVRTFPTRNYRSLEIVASLEEPSP